MWAQEIERGISKLTQVVKRQILSIPYFVTHVYHKCEKYLHFIAPKFYLKRNSTLRLQTGKHNPQISSFLIEFF